MQAGQPEMPLPPRGRGSQPEAPEMPFPTGNRDVLDQQRQQQQQQQQTLFQTVLSMLFARKGYSSGAAMASGRTFPEPPLPPGPHPKIPLHGQVLPRVAFVPLGT